MTKYKPEYRCPECDGECDGECERECECCHSHVVCDVCQGLGLNAAVVDVEAYEAATQQLRQRQDVGHRYSVAWIERGVCVGVRFNDSKRLAIADFLRKKTTEKNHE